MKTVDAAHPVPLEVNIAGFAIAFGAYTGKGQAYYGAKVKYMLECMLGMGFRLIKWDGL